jgi:hypothetical protein
VIEPTPKIIGHTKQQMSATTKPLPKVMKIHPFAQTFSVLTGDELNDLREDIRSNGIIVPILVNKSKNTILDGRNRWMIATELGVQKDVPYDVFMGTDDEVPAEILRLNVFRRHLTDDQRMAAISKVRGPMLEKEAKTRQAEGAKAAQGKGGSFKKNGKNGGATVAQLAKEAKATPYKAQQAEKARKAGLIDDVIAKKMTLKQAAKQAGGGKKRPRKVQLTMEDEVWQRWSRFLKNWPQTQHREVMKYVTTFIEDRRPVDAVRPSEEKSAAIKKEANGKATAKKATGKAKK